MITREDIVGEIGDLILPKVPGRTSDEQITTYDATGMALLDIAAGKAALDLASEKNWETVSCFRHKNRNECRKGD